MERLIDHRDFQELLGVYALDAVEPDEAAQVEQHLHTCPRCRDELSGHREVAGLLASSGADAPPGLWDRITAGMQETPPALQLDRIHGEGVEVPTLATVRPIGTAPAHPRSAAGRPWLVRGLASAVAIAAAVAVVLGIRVANLNDKVHTISAKVAVQSGPTLADVQRALADPGSRRVVLAGVGSSAARLDAVITPSGQGYVYNGDLTPLPADHVYQLWGVVGSRKISYGLLGTNPAVVAFTAGTGIQSLAVTAETATGVAVPGPNFVVVGKVSPV